MNFNINSNSSSVAHLLKALGDEDDKNYVFLDKKISEFRSTLDEKQRDNFEELCCQTKEYITFIAKKSHHDGVFEGMHIAETNIRKEIQKIRAAKKQ